MVVLVRSLLSFHAVSMVNVEMVLGMVGLKERWHVDVVMIGKLLTKIRRPVW
jgi:hypothetical protein